MNTKGAAPTHPLVTRAPVRPGTPSKLNQAAILLALTIMAVLVHGYHPMVEDAEIYVPAVVKLLNPALYPHDSVFFTGQTRLSLFPQILAASIRSSHAPLEWALFVWHLFSIFLLLTACWRILKNCFPDTPTPWFGVAILASLLTLPVAGTALYIMDQYLTARALSTPFALWAVSEFWRGKWMAGLVWIGLTVAVHPLMGGLVIAYIVVWRVVTHVEWGTWASAYSLLPVSRSYYDATNTRTYLFLGQWAWYEWIGALSPLAILWWFSRMAARNQIAPHLAERARSLAIFGLIFLLIGTAVSFVPGLTPLVRLQPMRSLHLIYSLMVLLGGGLLWQFVVRDRNWLGAILLVLICAGMFYAQRQEFSSTKHIEGPWLHTSENEWVQAFVWIREHTPPDAYFVLNPRFMGLPGEDEHGFRAIAQRSRLADLSKDPGEVTIDPDLADAWRVQSQAASNWADSSDSGLSYLHLQFGVNWAVLPLSATIPSDCPFHNSKIEVCHLK